MSEIKVNSIKGVGASAAAVTVHNSDGTCTLASGSKLNNCTTDGTTNLTIADGNLVVGTSGHGIDFSATSGTGSSELLDDYETGTFTPTMTFDTHQQTPAGSFTGFYTKVGNCVHFHARFALTNEGSGINSIHLTNLPFTPVVSAYAHPIASFYAENNVATGDNNHWIFGKLITDRYKFKVCNVHGGGSIDHFHMNMTSNDSIFGLYGFYYTSA